MASQSILLVIRRMWEYFTVPPHGDIGFIPEEHDPVGEFLEQQNRGVDLTEAVNETEVEKEALLMSNFEPETENSQANADISPSPVEILEAASTTGPSESESEVLSSEADSSQNEAEGKGLQNTTNNETGRADSEVLPQLVDLIPDEVEDKAEEGAAEEGHQDGTDDLLDVFRNEKEVKISDAFQDNLIDIDIQELLEESRDLMAEINARRYRRT